MNQNLESKNWERITFSVVSLVLVPINLAWKGWVFAQLWRWFVAPVFPSVPALSWAGAIGLLFLVGFATFRQEPRSDSEKEPRDLCEKLLGSIVVITPLVLLTGYAIHLIALWR